MRLLTTLERAKLPAASAQQFQTADARLNILYHQIMGIETTSEERSFSGADDGLPWTTVTKHGIRTTQRTWLRYRDAWITFAALKYPKVSADSVRTWLSRERTDALSKLLPGPN